MNILVRLPNWLGDMIMATAFLKELRRLEPEASIDIIVKKELASLANMIEGIDRVYGFSKKENPNIGGAIAFGRHLKKEKKYDLFFSLPNSFSAAAMGYAAGAKQKVGYSKELRTIWLNRSYSLPKDKHRVEQYTNLLERYYKVKLNELKVELKAEPKTIDGIDKGKKTIMLNFNSEAKSRRMPVDKAVAITITLVENIDANFIMIGSTKEKPYVDAIHQLLPEHYKVINSSGTTDIFELAQLIKNADLMISTDSGPGHLSNALGTPTLSYWGAGDYAETFPYNKANTDIIKVDTLDCIPCVKNDCPLYSIPKCLTLLNEDEIVEKAKKLLN